MTDKVQKIREELVRLKEETFIGLTEHENGVEQGRMEIINALSLFLDSLQEEPVRGDFEMALAEMIDNAQKRVVEPWVVAAQWKDELIKLAKSEEPISEELNEAAIDYAESVDYRGFSNAPWNFVQDVFKAGAKWQEKQDQENIELAEDHAMFAGMEKMREQMMAKAVDVTVHIDAGGYPYTPEIELYDYDKDVPLAKEGDKYKVVLIKEEQL